MKYAIITGRQLNDMYSQKIVQFEEAYAEYLMQFGYQSFVLPFTLDIQTVIGFQPQLILLTGGGDVPADYFDSNIDTISQNDRDCLEKSLIEYAMNNDIPLLGICRGMQMINGFLGGKITRDVLGRHPIAVNHMVRFLHNGAKYEVNSFHQDFIHFHALSNSLKAIGLSDEQKQVEAFVGINRRILGLQWHPERSRKGDSCREISDKLILNLIK